MGIEVAEVRESYRRARERRLALVQDLKDQPWGHRSFSVREPNGLVIILFSEIGAGAPGA